MCAPRCRCIPMCIFTLLVLTLTVESLSADDRLGRKSSSQSGRRVASQIRPPASRHARDSAPAAGEYDRRHRSAMRYSKNPRDYRESRSHVRDFDAARRRSIARSSNQLWHGYVPYPVGDRFPEAYRSGRADERYDRQRRFNERDMAARKARLLTQHEQAVNAGLKRMSAGQYSQALAAFSLAARLNQGDAACRIHLAQTQLALGRYADAGAALRRALQLQPELAYLDLHLERYYKNEKELGHYAAQLASWLRVNTVEPEVYFLFGYVQFQLGNHERAHRAFSRVREVMPGDELTNEFIGLTAGADRLDVGQVHNQSAPNDR